MNADLVSGSHVIGQSMYHIEFCPKYRYNALRSEFVKNLCIAAFREVESRMQGVAIKMVKVMNNHVHLFVDIPPKYAVSEVYGRLKGYSSYVIFRTCPGFRKLYPKGHFWSDGTFVRSVGAVTAETIERYIENQEEYIRDCKKQKQLTLQHFS